MNANDYQFRPNEVPEALRATDVWWRETLLRVALLMCAALGLEWLFYGGPLAAFGRHPHPYWIIVLPLAAARGLVAGLVGAGVGGVLVLVAATLQLPNDQPILPALTAALVEPLLFLTVAVIVGELCDGVRSALRDVEADRLDMAETLERVRYERDVLESTARELERRLAYGPADVGGLIGAARRMEGADVQGLYSITLDLVLEHVGDAASIVELGSDGSMVLARARGGVGADNDRDMGLVLHSPLVRDAWLRGEPVNAYGLGAGEPPPGPRMVAPLFDHARAVRALLLLDDLAPERLGPGTFRTFVELADWASSGLARLALGAAPLTAAAIGGGAQVGVFAPHRLGSPGGLQLRLDREFARCDRHALNLAVLGVQFALDGERAEGVNERLDSAVVELLGRGLRASDGLHAFGFPGCYAVVLAGADMRGAAVARARLEAGALAIERRLGVGARIHVVGPEQGEVTASHVLETLAKRFRAEARRPLGIPERAPIDAARLGSLEDLVERIACEAVLERRYGLPYQIVEVRLEPGGVVTPQERSTERDGDRLPEAVARAASKSMRGGAEAFGLGAGRYAYLLPGLASSESEHVLRRFEAALSAEGAPATVQKVFDSEGRADVDVLVRTLRGGRAA